MKLKTLLLLAFVALISFTGCAGDEVTANQDEKQGMTAFVVEENASPVTRTTAEYDGSGINFFWTPNDFIWVNFIFPRRRRTHAKINFRLNS